MRNTIRESTSIKSIANPEFVFGDMLKWINQAFIHSRFILDIFTRLGFVLLLQRFSLITKILIASIGFTIALVTFMIRKFYSQKSDAERHELAQQITHINPKDMTYMQSLQQTLKSSLQYERTFINTISCFLDMNVFSTFSYIILQNFTNLTSSLALSVFLISAVFSFLLHYHVMGERFAKQDQEFFDDVSLLISRTKENNAIPCTKAEPPKSFVMLVTESSLYTAFLVSILPLLSANFTQQCITYILSYSYFVLALPVLISGVLLYNLSSLRNSILSLVSGLSTASALIFMGYRYFIWFPLFSQLFMYEISGISIFKASCLFLGTLTGMVYHRAVMRLHNISLIYKDKGKGETPPQSANAFSSNMICSTRDLRPAESSQQHTEHPEQSGPLICNLS